MYRSPCAAWVVCGHVVPIVRKHLASRVEELASGLLCTHGFLGSSTWLISLNALTY